MENLRRSARSTKTPKYYNDLSPAYPDDEPANEFESRVATLNQESFPWKMFSAVDDILVYGLFSSKRRVRGYRAIKTDRAFGEEEAPITREEGIQIRKIFEDHVGAREHGHGVQQVESIHCAAEYLVKALPKIFSPDQLSVIQQYSGFQSLWIV